MEEVSVYLKNQGGNETSLARDPIIEGEKGTSPFCVVFFCGPLVQKGICFSNDVTIFTSRYLAWLALENVNCMSLCGRNLWVIIALPQRRTLCSVCWRCTGRLSECSIITGWGRSFQSGVSRRKSHKSCDQPPGSLFIGSESLLLFALRVVVWTIGYSGERARACCVCFPFFPIST